MDPVIIIPTYVGGRRRSLSDAVIGTYDHTTPITHQGELPRCLDSLRELGSKVPVILLVATEEGVDTAEAAQKIVSFAQAFASDMEIQVIDSQMVSRLHDQIAHRGSDQMIEGIGLGGYGAIRNLGLLAASVRGFDVVVFIDDDEVVTDPDFIETALHGLGRLDIN